MARLRLGGSFSIIPEGIYTFVVKSVEYKEDFGNMTITLANENGEVQTEKYSLIDNNGKPNEKAVGAFSFFAKNVLNILKFYGDIDEQWLVGSHVRARVEHTKVAKKDNPNEFLTFAHLKDYEVVEENKPNLPSNYETYFDDVESTTSEPVQETSSKDDPFAFLL